ncbi:hypothetical protein ACFYTQ_35425 [Nocardia sp. NPDC004068]|uniref:hypothetical protein n=1 Tax=Nocardia sp. NPDC004068 TaxID=3364303 RepID=UPI00369E173A
MLFPNNGFDDGNAVSGPTMGWDQWLLPEPTKTTEVAPVPAAEVGPVRTPDDAEMHSVTGDSAWSQWLDNSAPVEQATSSAPAPAEALARNRWRLALLIGGAGLIVGAVIAGSVALVSTNTPAPALPTPAVTPPPASVIDPVLGVGPGCAPTRTPKLVRGNGTGGTSSGPDAILAFQYGYYGARSGAAAWSVVAPGAQVSPVEAIDAGIATVPPGTRHCITITPAADNEYVVVIVETRPDSSVHTYQQRVTVTSEGGKTLIAQIGPVQ